MSNDIYNEQFVLQQFFFYLKDKVKKYRNFQNSLLTIGLNK